MFLLWVKLITQGEKRETSTKTCNETMLRDNLRVFVSRISLPLVSFVHPREFMTGLAGNLVSYFSFVVFYLSFFFSIPVN